MVLMPFIYLYCNLIMNNRLITKTICPFIFFSSGKILLYTSHPNRRIILTFITTKSSTSINTSRKFILVRLKNEKKILEVFNGYLKFLIIYLFIVFIYYDNTDNWSLKVTYCIKLNFTNRIDRIYFEGPVGLEVENNLFILN